MALDPAVGSRPAVWTAFLRSWNILSLLNCYPSPSELIAVWSNLDLGRAVLSHHNGQSSAELEGTALRQFRMKWTTCPLNMASNNAQPVQFWDIDDSDFDSGDDNESLASLETDDGQDHPPEKILAQLTSKNGFVWYLVKWQDCPVLRSSWEGKEIVTDCPELFETWQIEKKNQAEGKSQPLDIAAFNKAVLELETAERKKRILRRLKRKVTRVLSIVSD